MGPHGPCSSGLPRGPQEAPFPSIYLGGLHSRLVKGDALDVGQQEALFSEQVCRRGGRGSLGCCGQVSVGLGVSSLLSQIKLHPCPPGGFPGGSDGKETACNAGDLGSIPGSGRPPGEGHGNPLQYSCLENSMDRGVWQATVHGVAKSRTRLTLAHLDSGCLVGLSVTTILQPPVGSPS